MFPSRALDVFTKHWSCTRHIMQVGTLPKDKHEGPVATLWGSQLEASGLPTVDVAPGLADLFGVKDASEVMNVKKAAYLASKVMGFVVGKIEDIIDKEKKVKHSKLSGEGLLWEAAGAGELAVWVVWRLPCCQVAGMAGAPMVHCSMFAAFTGEHILRWCAPPVSLSVQMARPLAGS